MQKQLLIAIFVINFGSLLAGDSWSFRLGNYFCSFFNTKGLPLIEAISDYDNDDIKELGSQYTSSVMLWNHCSKLNSLGFYDRWSLSAKDYALLIFAKTMAALEAEWKGWHVDKSIEQIKFIEMPISIGTKNERKVRIDVNSPFYKRFAITNNNLHLHGLNVVENEAYHDELMFLQTQLHKMELYWAFRQKESDEKKEALAKKDYEKTHSVLANEIRSFKKPNNRQSFLRSCAKKQDADVLQSMRDAYRASNSENRS